MAEFTEDALYDMSDEELEAAYNEAKVDEDNSELDDEPTDVVEEVIDNEEEVVDELEQPIDDMDSDDNADIVDEVTENDDKEPEVNTENPDGEAAVETDDNSEAEKEVVEETVQPEQKYKFKANGLEYEFTKEEMEKQFPMVFGQAMNYTKKMQNMSKHRKTIDAIEQANMSADDLNLAIDVLKGDKEAIGELLKRTGVDALELDAEESKYVPKDYGRDENTLALKDIVDEISVDPEYQRTQQVLGTDWDDTSWNEMSQNPKMIKALHVDVKDGTFDKVQPIASKLKVYGGAAKSDLEYYKEAAGIYFSQEDSAKQAQQVAQEQAAAASAATETARQAELQRVEAAKAKRVNAEAQAEKRKGATPTNVGVGTRTGGKDYLDDSDEAFEEWYKNLQEGH